MKQMGQVEVQRDNMQKNFDLLKLKLDSMDKKNLDLQECSQIMAEAGIFIESVTNEY